MPRLHRRPVTGGFTGYYDLIIENNMLGIYWAGPTTDTTFISSDNSAVIDGTWHQLGFNVVYDGVSGQPSFTMVKDGNLFTATASASRPSPAGTPSAATFLTAQYCVAVGCASACGAGILTGMVGNILVQGNVLSAAGLGNGLTTADLTTFITQSSLGIPVVDSNTMSLIELLPAELTSGNKAYTDLATKNAITIGSPSTVQYVSNTYLDGLSEMVHFAPSTPFPGVDGGTDVQSEAMAYALQNSPWFRQYLPAVTLKALRAMYSVESFKFGDAQTAVYAAPYPGGGVNFTDDDYAIARGQLYTELGSAQIAISFYSDVKQYLGPIQTADLANLTAINSALDSNLAAQTSTSNSGDVITVLAGLLSIFGPEGKIAGTVLKGACTLANFLTPGTTVPESAQYPLGVLQGPFTEMVDLATTNWGTTLNGLLSSVTAVVSNWGALNLVPQYSASGQFAWTLAENNFPSTFVVAGQTYYMKNLLTQNYESASLTGSTYSIFCFLGSTPGELQHTYSTANGDVSVVIGTPVKDYYGSQNSNYPTTQVTEFVFGTGDTQLGVSLPEFWFQWGWEFTSFECGNLQPPS